MIKIFFQLFICYDVIHHLFISRFIIYMCNTNRAGVLVLGTRTRSTRVLNFWYLYCTRTHELQSDSTRTCACTRGQVLRYSCEYWHEYWYSLVHLRCKGENHHICEINSMTYHTGKFQIDLFCYNLNMWYMGCDYKFHRFFQFYHHWKINWITFIMSMFIFVIHPSPVSHSTFGWFMKIFT